ncbi:hypothetical protein AYI70_g5987 [Smittium culicis]|uniref:Uncharacterized protein n=1 Tax=Smittium culicis TaxID=133412 RepID=A0A1R1XS08_9FUNG|nr:hypothetical protein AYI70_g5987 [Smittium culicis]
MAIVSGELKVTLEVGQCSHDVFVRVDWDKVETVHFHDEGLVLEYQVLPGQHRLVVEREASLRADLCTGVRYTRETNSLLLDFGAQEQHRSCNILKHIPATTAKKLR